MSAVPKRNVVKPVEDHQEKEVISTNYQQAKTRALLRRLSLLGILFGMTASFFAYVHFQDRSQINEGQAEQEALSEELTALQARQTQLEREIELLNDEEYILKIARTQYFFSKDGEIIFSMPDEN